MADGTKITELVPIDTVSAGDLLAIVDDPTGSPDSKSVTAQQLAEFVESGLGTAAFEDVGAFMAAGSVTQYTDMDAKAAVLPTGGTTGQVLAKVNGTNYNVIWVDANSHTHAISDITGLQTELDGKASASHSHTISDVTGLQTALDGKAATTHSHTISNVTGLQTALDGKAAVSHTHVWADITDKPSTFTPSAHVHDADDITTGVFDVARLGTGTASSSTFLRGDGTWQVPPSGGGGGGDADTLEGEPGSFYLDWANFTSVPSTFTPSAHTHDIEDITGLQTELDGKASTTHTHAISDVTGLQTALDGKAASSHTHTIADVTGLQTALDGKAASSHSHAASDITSGVLDPARLGTGTASSSTFLRGDGAWEIPPSGGGEASDTPTGNFSFTANDDPVYVNGTHIGTLPGSPSAGDRCLFISGPDLVSLTFARNGNPIEEEDEDMTMTTPRRKGGVLFDGTSWRVF